MVRYRYHRCEARASQNIFKKSFYNFIDKIVFFKEELLKLLFKISGILKPAVAGREVAGPRYRARQNVAMAAILRANQVTANIAAGQSGNSLH